MSKRETVQQLCSANRRMTSHELQTLADEITIQDAIDAEVDYNLEQMGRALLKLARSEASETAATA